MNTALRKTALISELPHDPEAEKSILGALIRYPEYIEKVAPVLSPECFYLPAHRIIFQELLEMSTQNFQIDEILLADSLRDKGLLERANDFVYISELREIWSLRSNTDEYCKLVKEHFLTRQLIALAGDISQKSRDPSNDVGVLVSEFQNKLAEITREHVHEQYVHIKNVMDEQLGKLKELSLKPNEFTGLETGFLSLDQRTSGLQKSDLIIIAARPSMGKTAFATNIAAYSAIYEKKNVLMFSLEMSRYQIADRLLSSEAQVDSTVLRTGKLAAEDWDKITVEHEKISAANFYISDKPGIPIMEIGQLSRQLHKRLEEETGHGLDLIIVDYLQLVQAGSGAQNREQEISQISRVLKALAKQLEVTVIALSQLNRAVESRKDKRPMMSDIRESGSIEQDADIILFIYRDEVYDKESKDKGLGEIIISKHRNGMTGSFKLRFFGKYTKFANISELDEPYE